MKSKNRFTEFSIVFIPHTENVMFDLLVKISIFFLRGLRARFLSSLLLLKYKKVIKSTKEN